MKASFSLLLLAAVTAACARATGAVDDPADPAGPIEQPRAGAEEVALEVQVEQAKRDLRDRKRGKGGKGKRDDDQKDGAKARKSKSGKAKSGKGDTGTEHCLKGFNDILSVQTYMYGKGGVCEDGFGVRLKCVSTYSGCSYYEKSLRASSTFALDACVPFDLPDVLAYDAETGMCTLTGIDLKRPEEDSCQVPTAEYSTKIAFHADDSSTLFIDFSSNGGDSYYTEGEDDETRIATPYSDEGVRARRMQNGGSCNDCDNPSSDKKKEGESCGTRDLNNFIPSYDGTLAHTGCYENRVPDQNCLSGLKSADCCGEGCITYFLTNPSTYVCDRDECGLRGQACCLGVLDTCHAGLKCVDGRCLDCGGDGEPCCPSGCDEGFRCNNDGFCSSCKGKGERCGGDNLADSWGCHKDPSECCSGEIQEDGKLGYITTFYKCKDDCTPDGERCGYHGSIQDAGCWIDPNVCCSKKIEVDGDHGHGSWTNYKCGCGLNDGDYCDSDCREKGVESGRLVGGVYQSGKDIVRIQTPLCCGSGIAMDITIDYGRGSTTVERWQCYDRGCIEAGKICGEDVGVWGSFGCWKNKLPGKSSSGNLRWNGCCSGEFKKTGSDAVLGFLGTIDYYSCV